MLRRLGVRLAVLLVSVVAAIALAEGIVRALDPYGISDTFNAERYRSELVELVGPPRLYRHRPDRTLRLRGFDIHTDRHGCRGRDVAEPKPPGQERVLFLGDSVTFGWGVDGEETFVHRVGEALRERGPWEAINTGHMGYDTVQELGTYDELAPHYEPDLVVLVYVDNDVVPMEQVLSMEVSDPLEDPDVSEEAKGVMRKMRTLGRVRPYLPYLSALGTFYLVRESPAGRTGSAEHAVELGIDLEEGWRRSREALLALRDRTAAEGIAFCVLDYYTQDFVAEHCAEHGIPYASIAFTEEELAAGVRNSAADAHANERGHRILADRILARLDELGLP